MKISSSEIQQHDHSCAFFSSDDEFVSYAVTLVRKSVHSKEQCIVVTDEVSPEQIKKHLSLLSLSPERLIDEKQLLFGRFKDFYLGAGGFSGKALIRTYSRMVRASLQSGFRGLRGIGEIGRSSVALNFSDFIDYEMEVQELFFQYPFSAICAYRRCYFDEHAAQRVAEIHPFQIIKSLSQSPV